MPIFRSKCFLLTFALLVSGISLFGQGSDNSPYSRLGIGDLISQHLAANAALGGLSATWQDPLQLNLQNPAANAFLRSTAFEVGLFAKYGNLQGGDESATIWTGNLNYLALGFPMSNPLNQILDRRRNPIQWGMSLSLLPYSNVGYDIEIQEELPFAGEVTNGFEGAGGTYRLAWGNGVRYKNFALGVNFSYFFGKMTNFRSVTFNDLDNNYDDFFSDEISVQGILVDLGLLYRYEFKKPGKNGKMEPTGKRIIFGAYGNAGNSFSTNSSQFYRSFNPLYPDIDTAINVTDVIGEGKLPMELTAGIMYENADKFRAGVEYQVKNWSEYTNEAKPETLTDTWRVAAGLEFIPNAKSYDNYGKRIRYRLGGFYQTDPRSQDTELTQYAVTAGLGFPIILPRQQTSFVNLTLEVGQFGAADLLQETYAKMTVGFTLNDNSWFFKRKFN
jgi:hypothetical protein